MTKAERIFNETYRDCRYIVKKFGYEPSSRMNGLTMRYTDTLCTRTLNAISKLLESEKRNVAVMKRMNMERAEMLENALDMVQNTLNHEIELWRDINLCDFICD